MGKSKKIAIENYQKFQCVAHWSHRSEKNQICEKLLPIGLTVAHWSHPVYIIFIKLCLFWIFEIAEKCQIAYITYAYKTFYLEKLEIHGDTSLRMHSWRCIPFLGIDGDKSDGMHPSPNLGINGDRDGESTRDASLYVISISFKLKI
jgi:hypothetical protein